MATVNINTVPISIKIGLLAIATAIIDWQIITAIAIFGALITALLEAN